MSHNYSEIQTAFLDGLNEVFTEMFTENILYSVLDKDATKTNFYSEAPTKIYKEPISLVGKVITSVEFGEAQIESKEQINAVLRIPTKQLIKNGLAFSTQADLKVLMTGKFEYQGITYLIDQITPSTLVADIFQVYVFDCHVDKKVTILDKA